MLDKMIHKDELKLRLLMTNACNQSCPFCLNDFQKTKEPKEFLHVGKALDAIDSYIYVMREYFPLQVYFSGGEPTLNHYTIPLMNHAHNQHCRVTLNTNGTFPDYMMKPIYSNADCIHIGTYSISRQIANRALAFGLKHQLQAVYSTKYQYINKEFLDFYLEKNHLSLKIFQEFNDDGVEYLKFIEWVKEKYPTHHVKFRHTGVQENRGKGCQNCETKCITLRAAWIFPDGGISPCPQEVNANKIYPRTYGDWIRAMQYVLNFHTE
jgi:organic radical activating enzyme